MFKSASNKGSIEVRNVQLQDSFCSLCGDNEETTDHILTGCGLAAGVWAAISVWCRVPNIFAFSTKDLVSAQAQQGWPENKKIIVQGIITIAAWRVWKARNEKTFSNKVPKVADIISDIKTLGFLWFKNRAKWGSVDGDKWCKFDIM
ncbi:hypothetical protein HanHA300_Chr02g0064871 [Helianthus annuus]|uniref:uncharacterized protein LOC110898324 n=1 Tax=Helianthus annuus TaxID=4232 RepID=UPI000B900362|nr:uncharacterized protein LOC110898324 [Helianthus annuus]KAJ0605604.1 hypothetical protein HanHA300_Chr02g0064871 [Helianthus annuus]KAJ0619620.1 hypothetical protein HanHA89_Chr02g0073331 [Helianthus annuus]KAJ0778077.1 hypothetical protein HanLR1_Chr02g0067711 [Helianthus annuus]